MVYKQCRLQVGLYVDLRIIHYRIGTLPDRFVAWLISLSGLSSFSAAIALVQMAKAMELWFRSKNRFPKRWTGATPAFIIKIKAIFGKRMS
jgi:hypothetical protein